jgi:hypothetical protein
MEFRLKNRLDEKTEAIINSVIAAAIDVHRELGLGYLDKKSSRILRFLCALRGKMEGRKRLPLNLLSKKTVEYRINNLFLIIY